MAKICSRCSKTLSLRDSFMLDGNPICGDCLKKATAGSSLSAIQSENLKGMGGWLLFFVIACFLGVIVNFVQAFSAKYWAADTIFALLLAIFGIITGLTLIFSREKIAVHVARFFLGFYLVGAIFVVATMQAPRGYMLNRDQLWRMVFQAIISNLIWQSYFSRSKRVKATYISEEREPESDDTTKCPYCSESISKEAVACNHCGKDISHALPPEATCPECQTELMLSNEERIERKFNCPSCNKTIDLTITKQA